MRPLSDQKPLCNSQMQTSFWTLLEKASQPHLDPSRHLRWALDWSMVTGFELCHGSSLIASPEPVLCLFLDGPQHICMALVHGMARVSPDLGCVTRGSHLLTVCCGSSGRMSMGPWNLAPYFSLLILLCDSLTQTPHQDWRRLKGKCNRSHSIHLAWWEV